MPADAMVKERPVPSVWPADAIGGPQVASVGTYIVTEPLYHLKPLARFIDDK